MYPIVSLLLAIGTAGALCADETTWEEATLAQVWAWAEEESPSVQSRLMESRAYELAARGEDRERLPSLYVESTADGGQRVSPGEERALGISARANVHARAEWVFLDPGAHGDQRSARLQVEEALASALSEADLERRAVSSLYFDLLAAQDQTKAARSRVELVDAVADVVERRVEAGVETPSAAARAQRSRRDARQALSEAATATELARARLAATIGRCVHPVDDVERGPAPPGADSDAPSETPEVTHLLRRSERLSAEADAARSRDAFSARAFGAAGLYASRAYDRPIEPEYFLGVTARWQPDLFGVRRVRAESLEVFAEAARDEAHRRQDQLDQRASQLATEAATLTAEIDDLREAIAAEEGELERVRSRWEQGVAPWSDVLDAADRLYTLQNRYSDASRRLRQVNVSWAAATGTLTPLTD